MKNLNPKRCNPSRFAGLKAQLCRHSCGRVLLHLGCIARGGRMRFHLSGIRREADNVVPSELKRRTARVRTLILLLGATGHFALGQSFVTNTYAPSSEEFANPERGFYFQSDSYASAPTAIPGNLATYRINGRNSPGNTYTAKISLLLRVYYLDTFINAPISAGFLNSIQTDFNSVRTQGSKLIVRFAYNQDTTSPFNEPTKARILAHITQLKPLLQQNADVIAVLQHGFIGAWGEGYYTDIFYTGGEATTQNWVDRNEIVAALLDALPAKRMVQVRVPQHKQKYVFGPTAPTSAAVMSSAEAFTGTATARIGFHNDCYLADPTDFGTFSDYDIGDGTSTQDIINLRNYLALDARYTPVGGETRWVNPPTDDCAAAGGGADTDMAVSHYSYLNQGYNANVNDDWVTQGCMEAIKRRLGYRLELLSGKFRTEAQPGQVIPLTLEFTNSGYATPCNPRGLELVLRHTGTAQKYFAELSRDTEVRLWLPGAKHVVTAQLALPANLPVGNYDLLLNLPDPAPTLYTNIAYAVRLGSTNAVSSGGANLGAVWETATAYHRLRHTLTINSTATNASPTGAEIPALNYSAIAETYVAWQARNFATNAAAGVPLGDPDTDGRLNLVEFAVGSNPNVVQNGSYLNASYVTNAFFLTVLKGPGAADDVRYEVEGSSNLATGSWTNSAITILEDNAARIRVRYDGTQAGGFLRMKFSQVQ